MTKSDPDEKEIRRAAEILFDKNDVVELRAPRFQGRSTASGYYTDFLKLAEDAAAINRTGVSVYWTMNRVDRALLARCANHFKPYTESTTSDQDVQRRTWLPIDVDPKRPSGISSTEQERQTAVELIRQIRGYLIEDLGFPEPIAASSGNGGHLLFSVDLPNNDESTNLVNGCLRALANIFDSSLVTIDQTMGNAGRILKVYGTVACKGDSTTERSHRLASLLHVPGQIEVVTRDRLQTLADLSPSSGCTGQSERSQLHVGAFDVQTWLDRYKISVRHCDQNFNGRLGRGRKWVLKQCVWNPDHTDKSAWVIQANTGAIASGCQHHGCRGKNWHDMRWTVEGNKQGTTTLGMNPSVSFDSAPLGLPPEIPPVAAFAPTLLPAALRPWIEDVAERVQCPPDFCAVGAMIVLAAVVGRRVGIRPKQHDDWQVVPNLWGAAVGPPGIMKTPALQEPLKPLRCLEARESDEYEQVRQEHAAGKLVGEFKSKEAQKEIKKALAAGDADLAKEIAEELTSANDDEPTRKRLIVNDASVEKLGEILRDNSNGVLVYRDELVGLLRNLDKEGCEGARAFYLEAWNGTGRFTYDRIGRGTVEIPAAIVSVLGSIQPGPLREYLQYAAKNGKGDDGLIQRFQLMVYPDVSCDWKNVDRWPNADAKQRAYKVIEDLYRLDTGRIGARTEQEDGIPFIRFDATAQRVFDHWRADLEQRIRSGADSPVIEAHLSKYRSLVPSLALLIHLADHPQGDVVAEALHKAIAWAVYLESHARRILASAIDPGPTAARELVRHIDNGDLEDGFTLRDVYRPCWSGLTNRDDAERAVLILIKANWLAEHELRTEGRSKSSFKIHPKILRQPRRATDITDNRPVKVTGKNPVAPGDPPDTTDKSPGSHSPSVLSVPSHTDLEEIGTEAGRSVSHADDHATDADKIGSWEF